MNTLVALPIAGALPLAMAIPDAVAPVDPIFSLIEAYRVAAKIVAAAASELSRREEMFDRARPRFKPFHLRAGYEPVRRLAAGRGLQA